MSDYLWDKTGEPDEEVERLEKMLGALAHGARALELPDAARVERAAPRSITRPAFAAAAALALMLVAGAWLALSRLAPSTAPTLARSGEVHNPAVMQHEPKIMRPPVHKPAESDQRLSRQPRTKSERANVVLASKKRRVGARAERPREELAAVTADQQRAAKAQLVYALRLTGAKLSEVQTKVRGSSEGRPAPELRGNRIR